MDYTQKILEWRPHQESNLDLALRRGSFYPLNYGDLAVAQLSD